MNGTFSRNAICQNCVPLLIIAIAFAAALISCSKTAEISLTPDQITEVVSEMVPEEATTRPTVSVTPIPSLTQTVSPTPTSTLRPTSTRRPTRTPEPTSLPTLPPEETQAVILDLIANNGNCRLPCWWGFTPGITSWQTAKSFLETIAISISEEGFPSSPFSAYVDIPQAPEEIYEAPFQHVYHINDITTNTIDKIHIHWINRSPYILYTLSDILTEFGKPTEIRISTNRVAIGTTDFVVFLFYPENRFLVRFSYDGILEDDVIRTCLPQDGFLGITVWSPRHDGETFEDLVRVQMFTELGELQVKPLEETTSMDITFFYETFRSSDGPGGCIETPAELWPSIPVG